MSLVGNWQREAARFTPDLRVHVHHGADRLDGESLASALTGVDLVITTYGVATRDQAALGQVSWARVVCDEAQTLDPKPPAGTSEVMRKRWRAWRQRVEQPTSSRRAAGGSGCDNGRRRVAPRQRAVGASVVSCR